MESSEPGYRRSQVLSKFCFIYFIHSKPSGKGERLNILHAGGKDGWVSGNFYDVKCPVNSVVSGCDWIFKAKKGSIADYHQEMNVENFERWFKEKLLPELPANCLIVMDNTSYQR